MPLLLDVPFDLVIIGLAGLLLAWAVGVLFSKPLTWTLQQIPVVGGAAAGFVASALAAVAARALAWADGMAAPVTQLIGAPVAALTRFLSSTVRMIEGLIAQVRALAAVLAGAPSALWSTISELTGKVAQIAAAVAALSPLNRAIWSAIANLLHQAIPAARQEAVAQAQAYTDAQVVSVRHLADVRAHELELELQTTVAAETQARAEGDARLADELAAKVALLEAAIAGVRTWADTTIGADVKAVEGQITDLAKELAPLLAVPLVQELTQVIERVETMQRECVGPTCNYLKPQLPSLTAIGDAATLGLLIGLLGAAIRDPQGTAQAVAGASGALRSGVDDVLGPLLGVRV